MALALALPAPASATIVMPAISQPNWAELSAKQREILMPLSGEWDQLESFRRKKWLGIVQRYPAMTPNEQQHVQHRMKAWIGLSSAERRQAREGFKTLQKTPPESREVIKQRWQEYKKLPDDEKERLRKLGPKPAIKAQVKSAAGSKPLTLTPVTPVTPLALPPAKSVPTTTSPAPETATAQPLPSKP